MQRSRFAWLLALYNISRCLDPQGHHPPPNPHPTSIHTKKHVHYFQSYVSPKVEHLQYSNYAQSILLEFFFSVLKMWKSGKSRKSEKSWNFVWQNLRNKSQLFWKSENLEHFLKQSQGEGEVSKMFEKQISEKISSFFIYFSQNRFFFYDKNFLIEISKTICF